MADTLAPVLGASISGQSPVQQTHWAEGLADVVGGFAASLRKDQPSASAQRSALEDQAWELVTREFNIAATEAQVDGDFGKAQRRRDSVIAKVTPYIDISSGRGKALIQAVTGEDPERFLSNPDQMVKNELYESEAYKGFYLNTDPNLTPQERENLALAKVARVEANKAAILAAQTQWSAEGQKAYLDTIQFARVEALEIYSRHKQPGSNAVEDIRQARMLHEQFQSQLVRPPNIPDGEWAPIQSEIDRTNKMFTQMEDLLGTPALKNANEAQSAELLRNIGQLMINDAENVGQLAQGAAFLGGDPTVLSEALSLLVGSAGFLNKVGTKDLVSVGLKNNPDKVMADIEAGFSKATPKEKFDAARGLATLSNGSDISTALKTSPTAVNNWADGTMHGLAALKSLGSEETGQWITANDYDQVFGPAFFTNLEAVTAVDPVLAGELKLQALKAIDQQSLQLEQLLSGMEQSGPFIWDRTEGTFRLNPNPVGNTDKTSYTSWDLLADVTSFAIPFTGRTPTLAEPGADFLQTAVDELYGGDVNALIADKGARIHRAGFTTGDVRFKGLSQQINRYFNEAAPANASKYAAAFKKNTEIRDKLYATAAEHEGYTYTVPTEEVQGSLPGTLRQQNIMNASGSMTQRLLDKHEGGGDYDTLFGHSQNGGPFNGVKVTSMTISQVLDFANPRGPYGQWVKGQVGRVATPMGRFQIVGRTLREAVKEMGLDPENTLFTPEVQNAIFDHIAKKAIGNKTGAAARAALRGTWEGLLNASDADLDVMIEEIKTGKANFGPASTSGSRYGGGMGVSGQSIDDLLPNARGMALETQERQGVTSSLSTEGASVGAAPEGREVVLDEVNVRGGSEGETSASESVTQSEDAAISAESRRILRNLGLDDSTPVFNSMAEFEENLDDLPEGSVVVVNGRKITV